MKIFTLLFVLSMFEVTFSMYRVPEKLVERIKILRMNNRAIYKEIKELKFKIAEINEEIEDDEYFDSIDGYDDERFNEYIEEIGNDSPLRELLEKYRILSNIILKNIEQIDLLESEAAKKLERKK